MAVLLVLLTRQPAKDSMMPDPHDLISHTPDVQGGEPVLRGTRTPVRTVVILYDRVYDHDTDEVRRALPHLSAPQIEAALAYYAQHRAEIDRHIERHERALHGAMLAQ
jgi:uncharacterized protein (DUF433 family)